MTLKIRHNGVLGYFIEATAKAAEPLLRAPLNATFIHRQTLANQMRFTTVELAELDARIAQAGERALAIEAATFEAWREQACALAGPVREAATACAILDVAAALAEWAEDNDAVRPEIDRSTVLDAEGARHPVVEAAVRRAGGAFTPNDCRLDGQGVTAPRLAIVTGPNMAGKSTFLRQNALLAVLAQAGCPVPARRLRLGVVDQVAPGAELMAAVRAYATDLADNVSPRSMAVMKRQLWAVGQLSLRESIEVGNQEMLESFASEDFKEGVAHFVEKRQANFSGR